MKHFLVVIIIAIIANVIAIYLYEKIVKK